MSEQVLILIRQIAVMFLLMGVGFLLFRLKILDNHTTRQLANFVARVVSPSVIIISFQQQYSRDKLLLLLLALLLNLVFYVLSIAVAHLLYRRGKTENCAAKRMCIVFSNCAFMALPLLQALLGDIGIFYSSACIAAMNAATWTYGVQQLSDGRERIRLKSVLLNPGTLSLLIGIALFVLQFPIPSILRTGIEYLGGMNTPCGMLILGCYLAQTDLLASFKTPAILRNCFERLVLVPLLVLLLFVILPLDPALEISLLLTFAAPAAVICATFAQIFDNDYIYPSRVVAVSTLFSAITMPTLLALYYIL